MELSPKVLVQLKVFLLHLLTHKQHLFGQKIFIVVGWTQADYSGNHSQCFFHLQFSLDLI